MLFLRKKPEAPTEETVQTAPTKEEIAAAVRGSYEPEPRYAPEPSYAPRPHYAPEPRYTPEPKLPPHPVPGEAGQFAPMFIKVEKYREMISELTELKTFMGSIKQIFSVLSDLESTREEALKVMRASLARMEKAVSAVDSELLRPVGFEAFPHGEVEIKHVESSLSTLQQQLEGLRRDIEGLHG